MGIEALGIKKITLDFDSNLLQDVNVVQGDTLTRGFDVQIVGQDGTILPADNAYECRLFGVNSNYPDKTFYTVATPVNGRYRAYFSTDMLSKTGTLRMQVALYDGAKALIQSEVREIQIGTSLANGGAVGKNLVVDFTQLTEAIERVGKQEKAYQDSLSEQKSIEAIIHKTMTDITAYKKELEPVISSEKTRLANETARQVQESERVEAEKMRKNQETSRISKEAERVSQEKMRTDAENGREASEDVREKSEKERIQSETLRKNVEEERQRQERERESQEISRTQFEEERSKKEILRSDAEIVRQSQESSRVEAEKARDGQESVRDSNEQYRISQEETRKSQEARRVEAERIRAKVETERENAESSRSDSEKKRVSSEYERVNAESIRSTNEDDRKANETARQAQESERVEAEKSRAGKFSSWSKTMEGVIPNATKTAPGVVLVDGINGESSPYTVPSIGKVESMIDAVDVSGQLEGYAKREELTTLQQRIQEEIEKGQTKLTAGENITITEEGVISAKDTIYTHPTSHPATMITEDENHRFVTDKDKSTWNAKPNTDTVTTINGKTGAITKADIVALGLPAKDTTYELASRINDGLMSKDDYSKLADLGKGMSPEEAKALVDTSLAPIADRLALI